MPVANATRPTDDPHETDHSWTDDGTGKCKTCGESGTPAETSPAIISDADACEIAQRAWPNRHAGDPVGRFIETGMIGPWLYGWACGTEGAQATGPPGELVTYLRVSGERGPQPGWGEL